MDSRGFYTKDREKLFMNKFMGTGNMVRDPEYRSTQNGTPVCNFTIAITRRFKDASGNRPTDFINCVAWRNTAEFINNTGADLDIYDFHNEFVGMCPTSGLVMAGSDPDTAGSTGDLVGDEALLHIDQGDSQQQSWFVFPSEGPYTCNVSFRLGDDSFSYSDLEVHDDHARDLTELKRNQHLRIVTRISKGLTVSFSFQVMDWTEKTENIIFH